MLTLACEGKAAVAGQTVEAKTLYRALSHDPDIEVRTEARFRLALLLEQQKRYTDAAVELRVILDANQMLLASASNRHACSPKSGKSVW
tara:strand:+ start:4510 stop:4776 length:267 start_codon:yes stop_codon:yes gene_type:complete